MGSSNVLNSGSPKVDLCFVPTVISPSTCCGSTAYTMSSYICRANSAKMSNVVRSASGTKLYLRNHIPRKHSPWRTPGHVSIKDTDTCVELRVTVHRRHIRCRRGFEPSRRARGKCNVDDAAHRTYQTQMGNCRPSTADTSLADTSLAFTSAYFSSPPICTLSIAT